MIHDFNHDLSFSDTDYQRQLQFQNIAYYFKGCSIRLGTTEEDKAGGDWIVTLQNGRKCYVECKTRIKGCKKYWASKLAGDEELAIQLWSKMPSTQKPGVPGWSVDPKKYTDYLLYYFDPSDSTYAYMFAWQPFKKAVIENKDRWMQQYQSGIQQNDGYLSQSLFIPFRQLDVAVRMQGVLGNIVRLDTGVERMIVV